MVIMLDDTISATSASPTITKESVRLVSLLLALILPPLPSSVPVAGLTPSLSTLSPPKLLRQVLEFSAFGTFTVTKDITHLTKALFLSKVGKQTPVAARFSTSTGSMGTPDTDVNMFWDFMSSQPETLLLILYLFGDQIPDCYRYMQGFSGSAYKFVNSNGDVNYVKFKWMVSRLHNKKTIYKIIWYSYDTVCDTT
ncbi:hypothetical protein C0J52_26937 [Blattella germanica]|nr:hypothetical protein C0J52_26937 [Blattella germanica]